MQRKDRMWRTNTIILENEDVETWGRQLTCPTARLILKWTLPTITPCIQTATQATALHGCKQILLQANGGTC